MMDRDDAIRAVENAQAKIEDAIDILREVAQSYGGDRLQYYVINHLESLVRNRSWSGDFNLEAFIEEIEYSEDDNN